MSSTDKYRDSGQTQVRDIIQKINEEKPGKESSRESVTRADGTKAVRVVRKRRVLVSEKDKRRRSRRTFLFGVFIAMIGLAGLLIYFLWNLYKMSNQASYETLAEELRKAWGADRIELVGLEVNGFDLEVEKVIVTFPEASVSMIKAVELNQLKGSLQKEGVFLYDYIFEELMVQSASVRLREGAEEMKPSDLHKLSLLDVRQLVCSDFNVIVGDSPANSIFTLSGSELYLRYTNDDKTTCSLTFTGGSLELRSWKKFTVSDARMLLTPEGIEDLRANLSLPEVVTATVEDGKLSPEFYIAANIPNGSSIYSSYGIDSRYMQLSDFTDARMISFFTAQTRPNRVEGVNVMSAQMSLNPSGGAPSFRGEFLLQNVKWKNIPALSVLMSHLPSDRRSQYVQLAITHAKVQLDSTPEQLRMSFSEVDMSENYSVNLQGDIVLNAQQELSGVLSYGIPAALTRAEYPDGISDPVFKELGELAWLNTKLSGTAFAPQDDASIQDAAAAEARKSRPDPYQINDLDFNELNNNLERLQQVEQGTNRPSGAAVPTTPSGTSTLPSDGSAPLF